MAVLDAYTITREGIEQNADLVKAVILKALVKDELLPVEIADEWAASHTVITRKKGFFRTLTDRWFKEPEKDTPLLLVVKKLW